VLQKKNRAELLRQSLARLSPEHGEVIDLVYYHGKSVKEVAEIIGISEATVIFDTLVTPHIAPA
jgi:RNA polymerase sigma-70 factor, ECF subfamily